MTNGVRPWNAGLKERYEELGGTTFGTTYRNVTGSGGGGRSRPALAQECAPAGIRTLDTRINSSMHTFRLLFYSADLCLKVH